VSAGLPDRDGYVTIDQALDLAGIFYDAGVRDTETANVAAAATIYRLGHDAGYAAGVEHMSGDVDLDVLAVVDRINQRLAAPARTTHRHAYRLTSPRRRPARP
jgi:hypothetical protein